MSINKLINDYQKKKAQADVLAAEAKLIMAEIEKKLQKEVDEVFELREEPYGTAFFDYGDDRIVVSRAKDVKWDQEKLMQKYEQVKNSNSINADDVFRLEIAVNERFFEKANKEIKDFFIDARTVSHKPAKLSFKKRGE